ncbi:MaoC/PaaZ C-terminal domain-containing protein [Oceanicoccus sp. KOV_DT_Chl]|uniref:MaoC/PaaZ C-terminal domain-containing protein n=1 Tax=Oceanicoccus sp. KOV_DT_Chl TaxID=1904639 RepID=UPI000C7AE77A|nr:MaoC/PaaZ C-terminal domain-containing protein [Oceanicoccus sp. KOV_DT_Chl]
MKYYEDFELGLRHHSEQQHELTREEIISYCKEWDPMPFHVDEAAAAASYVGKLFTSSMHVVAIGSKLAHSMKQEESAMIAGLGWEDVRFFLPACVGDKLRVCSYVSAKRESKSRPDQGILTSTIELLNQDDAIVASYKIVSLIMKKPEVI